MTEETKHPLTDCDPSEVYKSHLDERNRLDDARHQAANQSVKTVIQLSSALLVLIAGFVTQKDLKLDCTSSFSLYMAIACSVCSVIFGTLEQFLSSLSHKEQLSIIEDFYTKKDKKPRNNKFDRIVISAHILALVFFVASIIEVAVFGFTQIGK